MTRSRVPAPLLSTAVLCATLLLLAGAAQAQSTFLHIEGIRGDSTEKNHRDWINAESVAFGARTATAVGATQRRAKATFEPITITKRADSASPTLLDGVARGRAFAKATIEVVRRGGKGGLVYLKVTLTGVVVTGYTVEIDAKGAAVEHVTLGYQAISYDYTPVTAAGSPGSPVSFEFDVARNR